MTIQEIESGINRIRYKSYSTGVLHISTPAWMNDLRWCLSTIIFLLDELKKKQSTKGQDNARTSNSRN